MTEKGESRVTSVKSVDFSVRMVGCGRISKTEQEFTRNVDL